MEEGIFKSLTIINSILIGILPLIFFRRQKLQEIKYKEIMELNVKTHDITRRAEVALRDGKITEDKDYDRLKFLVSRYKKHSPKLSCAIEAYSLLWGKAIERNNSHKMTKKEIDDFCERSEVIRELADTLLE